MGGGGGIFFLMHESFLLCTPFCFLFFVALISALAFLNYGNRDDFQK